MCWRTAALTRGTVKPSAYVDNIAPVTRARATTFVLALLTPFWLLLCLAPATSTPATAADQPTLTDPLQVRLSALTPSSIPAKGPIVMTGTVRNRSEATWQDINVYPVMSAHPIGDPAELAEAAASDPMTTASGVRLAQNGQFISLGDLAPGSSRTFTLRIKRKDIAQVQLPGVYWIGAQALGSGPDGRDALADGRARTFIPLVPKRATSSVSLIVPLRAHFNRDLETRIVKPDQAARTFTSEGRLGRLLKMFEPHPAVTWLVDPAVLDAAGDLRDNNDPMTLGPPITDPDPSEEQPSTPGPTTGAVEGNGAPAPSLDSTTRNEVGAWLSRASETLAQRPVLGLPYADPDSIAMLRLTPRLFHHARDLGSDSLKAHGVESRPAIAPNDGELDLDVLPRGEPTLTALATAPSLTSPAVGVDPQGHRILLSQAAAAMGGPGPDALSALNLRQRIVSEAALRAQRTPTEPLLVQLPDHWNPGADWARANFIGELDSGWLTTVPVPSSPSAGTATAPLIAHLPYEKAARSREVDGELLGDVADLLQTGRVLGHLLDTDNDTQVRIASVALGGAGETARADQPSAASLLTTLTDKVRRLMDRVRVGGTEFVTLSGGSGAITVSLINDLPQPVKIGLTADNRSGTALKFEAPEPITLKPRQRTTMRLQVRTERIGVNDVSISPVTVEGELVGTPLQVTIRSSEVGRWFWSVMVGAGAVFLFMMIKRIRDRLRTKRWRAHHLDDPTEPRPSGGGDG